MVSLALLCAAMIAASPEVPSSYDGFNNAKWGAAPDAVRQAAGVSNWQADAAAAAGFPKELAVTAFRASGEIAGYKADVLYYFWNGKFFQATVTFPQADLVNYDFNYNVFRSVNDYYNAIRTKTVLFVKDIYRLLEKKYGKKKPWFKELDPKNVFADLDARFKRESWNLRYHPYDYYLGIKTQAYARWDFPKTRAIFSVAICASDKRFEYTLSCSSLELVPPVTGAQDSLRMKGL